ncbi:hypothetical protein LINPERPRIM_LOCUS36448 [Linum perenne]
MPPSSSPTAVVSQWTFAVHGGTSTCWTRRCRTSGTGGSPALSRP